MDKYLQTNNITLHYIEHDGTEPPLVMMPGLSMNAHYFDGLVAAGLNQLRRVLALDLRGRGLSDKPETGYSFADHAADVIGLLDKLGLEQVILGGHSFGGLLTFYLAAKYPERITKAIVIDAAAQLHPRVGELIKPSVDRLGKPMPSMESYLQVMRDAPHIKTAWLPEMEDFFRYDVETLADGSVMPRTSLSAIMQVFQAIMTEKPTDYISQIQQPLLLLNATEPYGPPDYPPLLPRENALATVAMLPHGRYVSIGGNHLTMGFGDNATQIVQAIREFITIA